VSFTPSPKPRGILSWKTIRRSQHVVRICAVPPSSFGPPQAPPMVLPRPQTRQRRKRKFLGIPAPLASPSLLRPSPVFSHSWCESELLVSKRQMDRSFPSRPALAESRRGVDVDCGVGALGCRHTARSATSGEGDVKCGRGTSISASRVALATGGVYGAEAEVTIGIGIVAWRHVFRVEGEKRSCLTKLKFSRRSQLALLVIKMDEPSKRSCKQRTKS